MGESIASEVISMFLSGPGHTTEEAGCPERRSSAPFKRILLILSGRAYCLSHSAKKLAFGLGQVHAAVTLYQLQDSPKDISAYDGVVMGIAPDNSGCTQRAFAFIRSQMETLAATPVSIFFLLDGPPALTDRDQDLFKGLAGVNPLDVQIFHRDEIRLSRSVTAWARQKVWPLMETAWLADMIFPSPDPLEPVYEVAEAEKVAELSC